MTRGRVACRLCGIGRGEGPATARAPPWVPDRVRQVESARYPAIPRPPNTTPLSLHHPPHRPSRLPPTHAPLLSSRAKPRELNPPSHNHCHHSRPRPANPPRIPAPRPNLSPRIPIDGPLSYHPQRPTYDPDTPPQACHPVHPCFHSQRLHCHPGHPCFHFQRL